MVEAQVDSPLGLLVKLVDRYAAIGYWPIITAAAMHIVSDTLECLIDLKGTLLELLVPVIGLALITM